MTFAPSRRFRRFTSLTAVLTYLLVVMGGVVRVTGSGLGCGETDQWPFCRGQLLPPLEQTALIEFSHRWIAAMATAAVVALAIWVYARYRQERRLVVAATVVVALFLVQIALGAITVEFNLPSGIIMLHLANALLLLGALVWIAVSTNITGTQRSRPARSVLRLATAAAVATYVLALSGAFVVANGADAGCTGWPLCGNGFQLSSGQLADINLLHRFIAGAVVLLLGFAMMRLRRARPADGGLRSVAIGVTLLVVAQVIAGAVMVELHLPPAAQAVHLALASALWAAVVAAVALARGSAEEVRETAPPALASPRPRTATS
ncbi:MAG: COX15/CtaA family protein [Candidatus Dormibacteria bacterium]